METNQNFVKDDDYSYPRKTGFMVEDDELSALQKIYQERTQKNKESLFEDGVIDLKMEWNSDPDEQEGENQQVSSASDALVLSQLNKGCVDIPYIAKLCNQPEQLVISSLKGSIFQNPQSWDEKFNQGWETADEYLSGNVRVKLNQAIQANGKYSGYFQSNIEAILKVLPKGMDYKDIYITLGSPWIPTDIIEDFIYYMFSIYHSPSNTSNNASFVLHDEITGKWEIENKKKFYGTSIAYNKYGTMKIQALHILEKTLNAQTPVVYTRAPSLSKKGKIHAFVNKEETTLALEKQQLQIDAFKSWVWKDPKRRNRLCQVFDEKFGCILTRHYDGSFLNFEGMNKKITLYSYQKNAVARILFSPNTLLAHDVGSGKTYIMVVAGMELKRMGLSKKNLYVVPNNIIGQWKNIFYQLYPQAKVLCVNPNSFIPSKRKKVLTDIKTNDYDAIIIAYSSFNMIPLSNEYKLNTLTKERDEIQALLNNAKKNTSSLQEKYDKLSKEIESLQKDIANKTSLPCFNELGITRMFIDEAHNYKNVPIQTSTNNIYGVSENGSTKCQNMLDKVRYIQSLNNGGGIVMATGTPITNSLTDLFVVQKYLQNGALSILDIHNFDSWISMFAERSTEFEVDIDTSKYRLKSRFSKFHNLPELTSLLSMIADFHSTNINNDLPSFNGYDDIMVPKSKKLALYLQQISTRADEVRSGRIDSDKDNMLKITLDGRKAALDIRLVVKPSMFYHEKNDKVHYCAKNVADIYFKTMENKSTQLVFSDLSIPSNTFNIYSELKRILIKMNVKENEIAFIHDAKSESARAKLFDNVNKGNIRVLIGSTFKLGMGVNIQTKLIAIHHLDVPWRPSDMRQREGRILRQGNTNPEVKIFRYITEGSFDAYSWQLLETKQNFITALLAGSVQTRTEDDVDDTILSYGEVKALAIGNPLIKERVTTYNELLRVVALKRKYSENREFLEKKQQDIPKDISYYTTMLEQATQDNQILSTDLTSYSPDEKKELRQLIHQQIQENIMQEEEQEIASYKCFKIFLPKYMLEEKPYLILRNKGEYTLMLGEGEKGIVVRLENFCKNFPKLIQSYSQNIDSLNKEAQEIKKQLSAKDPYESKINKLLAQLKNLDKQLGVNKR